MKLLKSLTIAAFALFSVQQLNAQSILLDAETNNRNIDIANCWSIGGFATSNSSKITGNFSYRSGAATNMSLTAFWIKTPWIKPGNGNITLKARMDNTSGVSYRAIVLQYLPYDPVTGNSAKEGAGTQFYTYEFAPFNTSVRDLNVAIPAAIANSNQPYKIMLSAIGTGGTARIIIDDWSTPATYFADPANSCLSQALIQDADNDGVADNDDAYPNDATRAYNNFYPTSGFGTLMFEDLWPAIGDYDFNDVVVNYRYNKVTNAQNNVVEVKYTFVTRATGASFHNGFAFQLNGIEPSKITGVTGTKTHNANWLSNATNGTENNQTFANIIVVDDVYKVLAFNGGSGINVDLNIPHAAEDTANVTVSFNTTTGNTTALTALNHSSFNPYIIINQERGKEVHLANFVPSSKANTSYFGQNQDATNPGLNRYYKTENNLPWALDVAQSIPYPLSKVDFVTAYLKFAQWAQSNGGSFNDWYLNQSGYRDNSKLYIR